MQTKRLLIADSGSTKTDWIVVENGEVFRKIKTDGINPFQMDDACIKVLLSEQLLSNLPCRGFDAIHFYGAGCRDEKTAIVRDALREMLTAGAVNVSSDIMAAAHALCGASEGIACILGTGANSCLYDGEEIVASVSPLGYILGDEGSGAVLGKRLIADVLKGQMPEELRQAFLDEYDVDVPSVLEHVYRRPFANRYLASFAPFLKKHENTGYAANLLHDEFTKFFIRNICPYNRPELPVHFVGSIAHHFSRQLCEAGEAIGLRTGNILQSPADNLVTFLGSKRT